MGSGREVNPRALAGVDDLARNGRGARVKHTAPEGRNRNISFERKSQRVLLRGSRLCGAKPGPGPCALRLTYSFGSSYNLPVLNAAPGRSQMAMMFWVPRANSFARVLSARESTLKQV